MRVLFILALVAVVLSGCATAYQPQSVTGRFGYSETRLGENIFQVSFRGNAKTSRERASDFDLLRSAEVALENGFRYFVIVESEKGSNVMANTYGSVTATTYNGHIDFISNPEVTNTILCFKEKPKINGLVFDAEFVARSIRKKYDLNK